MSRNDSFSDAQNSKVRSRSLNIARQARRGRSYGRRGAPPNPIFGSERGGRRVERQREDEQDRQLQRRAELEDALQESQHRAPSPAGQKLRPARRAVKPFIRF